MAQRSALDQRYPFPGRGDDISTVQELLGHAEVSTTMIYTYVVNPPGLAAKTPADI